MPRKSQAVKPPAPTERLGFLLYRVGLKIAQVYAERTRHLGFSPVEIGLLTQVASCGEDHARAIARTLGVSPQTVVNVATRLEAKRLVRRQKIDSDRRMIQVSITQKGLEVLRRIDAVIRVFDQELVQHVGESHCQAMLPILHKLLAEPARTLSAGTSV